MSARPDPTLPETPLRRWRSSPEGFSYRELARRIGRDWRFVMRLAAGGSMSAETAISIHRETGISLDELLPSMLPREPRPRRETSLATTGLRNRRRGVDL